MNTNFFAKEFRGMSFPNLCGKNITSEQYVKEIFSVLGIEELNDLKYAKEDDFRKIMCDNHISFDINNIFKNGILSCYNAYKVDPLPVVHFRKFWAKIEEMVGVKGDGGKESIEQNKIKNTNELLANSCNVTNKIEYEICPAHSDIILTEGYCPECEFNYTHIDIDTKQKLAFLIQYYPNIFNEFRISIVFKTIVDEWLKGLVGTDGTIKYKELKKDGKLPKLKVCNYGKNDQDNLGNPVPLGDLPITIKPINIPI